MPNLQIGTIDITNREENRLTKFIEKQNVELRKENAATTKRNEDARARDPNAPQEALKPEWTLVSYANTMMTQALRSWVAQHRSEEAAGVGKLYEAASDAKRAAAVAALQ